MKHINREFEIKPNVTFLLVVTFSYVKYFLLWKYFNENVASAYFEDYIKTKLSNYVVPFANSSFWEKIANLLA